MFWYQIFRYGLWWNTIESVGYYSIFLAHQLALYFVLDTAHYGYISALLSSIYALLIIVNLGLDYSLPLLLARYIKSKKHIIQLLFRLQLLIPQCIVHIFILISVAIFLVWYCSFYNILPFPLLFLLCSIFFLEGIRKTLRTTLQLLVKFKITALTELITLIVYVSTVWLSYYYYGFLTPISVLLSMPLFISLGSILPLLYQGIKYYKTRHN